LPGWRDAWSNAVELLHGQRIHVGAQADRAFRVAVLDDADHAGLAQPAHHRDAPFGQARGDHVGGALFFVAQFRVGVQVAPDRPVRFETQG
jgi:hypothetical protein